MNGKSRGELILFPKSVDYYQIELTKLLETEAYGKAVRMLEMLVECKTEDERLNSEWAQILAWLRAEFPDAGLEGENDPDDAGEEEMLKRHVAAKASQDGQYAKKLLGAFKISAMDKQLLALDQLGHLEDDSVVPELLEYLRENTLHPFVSFKLLQTLAKLGTTGEVTFGKLGEIITVEVERTPLSQEHFPEPLPFVSDRVHQMAEIEDPTISYFAKETWNEFLVYAYGTSVYRDMLEMDEQEIDVWASALHVAVGVSVFGNYDAAEWKERYGITEMMKASWDKAYESLSGFFRFNANGRI